MKWLLMFTAQLALACTVHDAPDRVTPEAKLTVTFSVEARTRQGRRMLAPGDQVGANERLAIYVDLNRSAYVQLALGDAAGKPRPLSEPRVLAAGLRHRLPETDWLELDATQSDARIYLVTSLTTLAPVAFTELSGEHRPADDGTPPATDVVVVRGALRAEGRTEVQPTLFRLDADSAGVAAVVFRLRCEP